MKKGIEELIKNSLENSQEAYNPASWLDMQNRLDKAMPVAAPKSTLGRTLGLGLAGAVLVGSAIWFAGDSNESIAKVEKETERIEKEIPTETKSVEKVTAQKVVAPEVIKPKVEIARPTSWSDIFEDIVVAPKVTDEIYSSAPQEISATESSKEKSLSSEKISFGDNVQISSYTVCSNSTVSISNMSTISIYVNLESKTTKVEPKASKPFSFKNAGKQVVQILNSNNDVLDETTVQVKEVLVANVSFTQLEYINGLPTIVGSISNVNDFTSSIWMFKNGVLGEGSKVNIHTYYKGEHSLFLATKDINGCANNMTESLSIDEDYNLLAQTGLNPASSNPAVSSFMPRALLDRNTGFTLVITDIKTRSEVFRTRDASNPWNGADKTGRIVNGGSYIWTVILDTPEQNEKKQYGGELTFTSSN